MKTRRQIGLIGLFFFLLNTSNVLADKSAIKIEVPDQVVKGSEVVIKLQVSHSTNNLFHYTNWVSVKDNGKEIARWDYSTPHEGPLANGTRRSLF